MFHTVKKVKLLLAHKQQSERDFLVIFTSIWTDTLRQIVHTKLRVSFSHFSSVSILKSDFNVLRGGQIRTFTVLN